MMQGLAIGGGFLGSYAIKGITANMVNMPFFDKIYGAFSILGGGILTATAKGKIPKSVGMGLVAAGVFDLIAQWVPGAANFLPTVNPPLALSGADDYGRRTYGASLQPGSPIEVVGGTNISSVIEPEIIGDDVDLQDMLDMF